MKENSEPQLLLSLYAVLPLYALYYHVVYVRLEMRSMPVEVEK